MEFVKDTEVLGLLKDHGIRQDRADAERIYLRMTGGAEVVRLHLASERTAAVPDDGAKVIHVAAERLPDTIDNIVQSLGLSEIVLVPVAVWRHVFDAVAFSLAEHEGWQEIDATATVELNTRDPLLCGPADVHTFSALMKALLSDADNPKQGLMITSTAAPLLVEVIPDGALRVSFGSQVLADEVEGVLESS